MKYKVIDMVCDCINETSSNWKLDQTGRQLEGEKYHQGRALVYRSIMTESEEEDRIITAVTHDQTVLVCTETDGATQCQRRSSK